MNGCFNNMFFQQPFGFNNFMPFQMPVFNMPVFNFMPSFQPYPSYSNIWNPAPSFNINQSNNTDSFVRTTSPLNDYNSSKGTLLANIAKSRVTGNSGYCAKFVQEAISLAGLGGCTRVNAHEMSNTLKYNPNFKEISTKDIDVSSLPAGCILVYGIGVRNSDEIHGHTEITTGDGKGVSDGISETLHPTPSAIFIPV